MLDLGLPDISVIQPPFQKWEGAKNLTNDAYHADKRYLSASDMAVYFCESPMAYKLKVINNQKDKSTDSLDFGSIAHEAVLEGLLNKYQMLPEFKPYDIRVPAKKAGATKKHTVTANSQKAKYLAENQGKTFIVKKDFINLNGMFHASKKCKLFQEILNDKDSLVEQAYYYLCPYTGMLCKFKADVINVAQGYIFDYKTTKNASPFGFKSEMEKHAYAVKAGHYLVGAKRLFGKDFTFIWGAQNKKFPYEIGIYSLDEADRPLAVNARNETLRAIQNSVKKNHFPDWSDSIRSVSLSKKSYLLKATMNEAS